MKYFLHDTNSFDDEKVTELFMNFGYEGLGLFYTILEKLGKQEKPVKTEVLKAQLKVGKRLGKCWNFMEEIGLIHSNNGETFNKQILNFSEKYQIKKEKTRKKVSDWRDKQRIAESVTGYVPVSNPSKEKESKEKESKVIKKDSPDFVNQLISLFQDIYFKSRDIEYTVTNKGKERSAAGKILKLYRDKVPNADSKKTIQELATYFEACINIEDTWLYDNMSLPIIINQFTKINNLLKNGSKRDASKKGATKVELATIISRYFGEQ